MAWHRPSWRDLSYLPIRRPLVPLILMLAVSVVLGVYLPQFSLDASTDSLILQNDPDLPYYNITHQIFPSDDLMIVTFGADDVLSGEMLAMQDEVVRRVRELEGIASVDGPTTVPLLKSPLPEGRGPEALMAAFSNPITVLDPRADRDLAREELTTHPAYAENLIATDARHASLLVTFNINPPSHVLDIYKGDTKQYQMALEDGTWPRLLPDGVREGLPTEADWSPDGIQLVREMLPADAEERIRIALGEMPARLLARHQVDALPLYLDREQLQSLLWLAVQGTVSPETFEGVIEYRAWLSPRVYMGEYDQFAARREALVRDIYTVLDDVGKRYGVSFHTSGVPVLVTEMVAALEHDMLVFGFGVSILMLIMLLIVFRRWKWVVVPVLTCIMVVAWVLGLMVILGVRSTVVTANISSLLFIIGMAHSIHLTVRCREIQLRHADRTPKEMLAATVKALWEPCVYTALTTCAGFASLVVSEIGPVVQFGEFMALGVVLALLISFGFFPAAMALMGLPSPPSKKGELVDKVKILDGLARISIRWPWVVIAVGFAVLAVASLGVTRITAETKLIDYFHEDSKAYQGLAFIDRNMGGTTTLEVAFKGPITEYFYYPQNQRPIRQIHEYLDSREDIGKVISICSFMDYAREIRDHLGPDLDDQAIMWALKEQLPAQVESYVSRRGRWAKDGEWTRVVARVRETSPGLSRQALIDDVNAFIQQLQESELDGQNVEVRQTGIFLLYTNLINSLVDSQVNTLGLVLAAVLVMFILFFTSLRLAIIALIPNLLPIFVVLGVMGYAGIPLDMITVMIASVSLGIAVDGTIHYTSRFRHELYRDPEPREALRRTHLSIGRAILYTSITIVGGFWILVFSRFVPTVYFGLFTGVAMLAALFGSLTFLPSLLLVFKPVRVPRPEERPPDEREPTQFDLEDYTPGEFAEIRDDTGAFDGETVEEILGQRAPVDASPDDAFAQEFNFNAEEPLPDPPAEPRESEDEPPPSPGGEM